MARKGRVWPSLVPPTSPLDPRQIRVYRLAGPVAPAHFKAAFATPIFAQSNVPAAVLKHLKTSRDFTLKVADQMPESAYDFKLTPPQMSFAEQIVHLTQALDEYIAPFSGEKPNSAKPASMS